MRLCALLIITALLTVPALAAEKSAKAETRTAKVENRDKDRSSDTVPQTWSNVKALWR